MQDKATYTQPPSHNKYTVESKKLDLDAGILGKCFGSKSNAPSNIAGFFLVIMTVSGIAVLFISSAIPAGEYWKIITPLITMSLGYIFGKSSKEI